jgi:hypothetical protein
LFIPTLEDGVMKKLTSVALLVILAGCAELSAAPSSRYDGVYELSATTTPDLAPFCAPDKVKVTIRDGRLDFTVHPPDGWHGFVDQNGYFHGESAFGAREFKLLDGISVSGIAGDDVQRCEYRYRFKLISRPAEAHS